MIEKFRRIFTSGAIYILCAFVIPISSFLLICSLFFTTVAGREGRGLESIDFTGDFALLNIVVLAALLAVMFLLRRPLCKLGDRQIILFTVLWTVIFGFLWVCCAGSSPTNDSAIVSQAAYQFSMGDYSAMNGTYFSNFPFQLGYVLYSEILIRLLFIRDAYLALELINVLCLASAYVALLKITGIISRSRYAVRLCAVLLALCVQPIFFSTFLYGNIPGFMFSAFALLFTLKFIKNHRIKHGVLAAVMTALAVTVKMNNVIVLVAECIILLVDAIRSKKLLNLAAVLAAVLFTLCAREGAVLQYELRSGVKLGSGIPIISWAAMGLNEAYTAPGWYTADYTVINFNECDRDPNIAAQRSTQAVRERLADLASRPSYAVDFFCKKTLSQWNEPTFQSIWTNQVRGHYYPAVFIAGYVCGEGESTTKSYCDLCLQLVYFGAAVCAVFTAKHKNLYSSLLFTVVLGGFMYHMIFEAKSQYIITYFMLLIPLAAYGILGAYHTARGLRYKIKRWRNNDGKENSL